MFLFCSFAAWSSSGVKPRKGPIAIKPYQVSGTVKGFKGGIITLLIFRDNYIHVDTITPQTDGSFSIAVKPKFVPCDFALRFVSNRKLLYVYARPGYKSIVNADFTDAKTPVYHFDGDAKEINEYNKTFYKYFNYVIITRDRENLIRSKNFKQYKSYIDSLKADCATQLLRVKNQADYRYKSNELATSATRMIFDYTIGHSDSATDPGFIAFVQGIDLNNFAYCTNGVTSMAINYYMGKEKQGTNTCSPIRFLSMLKAKVRNQAVINDLSTRYVIGYLGAPNENVEAIYAKYKAICTDKADLAKVAVKYNDTKIVKAGMKVPDVTLTDADGKQCRLSDFKGKLLYVDVWATWCGPCKKETPYLAQLVDKFKGNDKVCFVSISVDDDVAAWKSQMKKEKPAWNQYVSIGGFKSEVCTKLKIEAVPRFILIDKDGKFINPNADRPSSGSKIVDIINNNIK